MELTRLRGSSPHQAGPRQKSNADLLHFIEVEFAQPYNLEDCPQFFTNLAFCDHRRPGLVRLTGVAGEYQADAVWMRDLPHCALIALHIDPADNVVTTAVKDEIVRAEIRQIEHVGAQEGHRHAFGSRSLTGAAYGGGAEIDRG